MSRSRWFAALAFFLVQGIQAQSSHGQLRKGLSPLEELFAQYPSAEAAKEQLRYLTSEPHVAGTSGDQRMADFVKEEFEKAGIPQVSIYELEVMLNYPNFTHPSRLILRSASNDHDVLYKAKLSEAVLEEDGTSDTLWRNHTFHGYSPPGYIASPGAPLVYANYGRPQDFDALEKVGVLVNGTIVLVRYGKCFRGLKVQNAQERGAVGVLIYSDPQQDGAEGHPGEGFYPNGPWRPPNGVQRGSVQFNSKCAGDPFRIDPRYAQLLHGKRNGTSSPVQELCGVSTPLDLIPSIPSLPISYEDATPLLKHLDGPLAYDVGGSDFCGGIANLTYRVGPSTKTLIELFVSNTNNMRRSIPNVVGVIPGKLPGHLDMPILMGNHRDAWVYGAADPNSGTAGLLQVAYGLGNLYQKHQWQPLRTIYLLSWSGEEYGLLGSTGWGELEQEKISRALAYLNVDTIVSGDHLKASASPSLTTLWKSVLLDLNATESKSSHEKDEIQPLFADAPLGELRDANTDWRWSGEGPPASTGDAHSYLKNLESVGILGSGSDYTVFLDHLGIPSLDFRFERRGTYGQYHSIYDSFTWMEQFGGSNEMPGSSFDMMALGAKIWGVLALRLASSKVVPLDQIAQGEALHAYADSIEKQHQIGLDLTALYEAIALFKEAAAKLQLECLEGQSLVEDGSLKEEGRTTSNKCNEQLALVERRFCLEEGLPYRPWFKHVLQAPGMHLGYAAHAFPGIQQAIDDSDIPLARRQTQKVTERILEAANYLL